MTEKRIDTIACAACSDCGYPYCDLCTGSCERCSSRFCDPCAVFSCDKCDQCNKLVCEACRDEVTVCASCSLSLCRDCGTLQPCINYPNGSCENVYCDKCKGKGLVACGGDSSWPSYAKCKNTCCKDCVESSEGLCDECGTFYCGKAPGCCPDGVYVRCGDCQEDYQERRTSSWIKQAQSYAEGSSDY